MKKITLKSLTLVNFKGEKERTTVFNTDVTTISGGNGLGKSRHFEAFIWLLFGKDTQGRKDFNIRSIENGELVRKVECSVTGVLDVDGSNLTLKRCYVEDWQKSRATKEYVFKGNHTECWWNEVPVNVGEYASRVHAILDESVFKMITNPAFFANMPWTVQREQLFQLAGTITDSDIAKRRTDFQELLDRLNDKPLADYKREIAAKKRRLNAELAEIKPRIDQTHKMKPKGEDFAALETELTQVDSEIAGIEKQITDHSAAIRAAYDAEQAKQAKINALKRESQKALFDAQTAANNAAYESNAARRELEATIKSQERELASYKREESTAILEVNRLSNKVTELKEQADELRKEWFMLNASRYEDADIAKELQRQMDAERTKTYQGETVCPTCGQTLPLAMQEKAVNVFVEAQNRAIAEIERKIADAKAKFNNEKKARMDAITNEGKTLTTETIAGVQKNRSEAENQAKEAHTRIDETAAAIEANKTKLATMQEVKANTIVADDVARCVEIAKEVAEIEKTISTDTTPDTLTSELQEKKAGLSSKRDEIKDRLKTKGEIERADNEIARLDNEAKKLAQQISDLEKDEITIGQFTKAKVEECEKRINAMFTHVSFRLFDYTIEGLQYDDPEETCVPLVGGVPYPSANTAGQVNAGLDIINVLCRFYGVNAPIFIDNRESVNEIIPMDSQIINLVVTNDKELSIK